MSVELQSNLVEFIIIISYITVKHITAGGVEKVGIKITGSKDDKGHTFQDLFKKLIKFIKGNCKNK